MNLIQRAADYNNPKSLGFRLRKRRSLLIGDLIETCFKESGACRIIDIGGTEPYWKIFDSEFLRQRNVSITLINTNKTNVTSPMFRSMAGDGCELHDIATNSYDFAHSNSVIEHVGDWTRMERFAAEIARVARRFYVQTPSFWFPLEPHFGTLFFHWLPEPLRVSLQMRYSLGHHRISPSVQDAVHTVQSARLLDRRMLGCLFPDAEIRPEKIMSVTKSLIAIRR